MTTPITIEAIEGALDDSTLASFCLLIRLRDALVSGEYALVSKADREKAIEAARNCGTYYAGPHWDSARAYGVEARQLLHLDPPTQSEPMLVEALKQVAERSCGARFNDLADGTGVWNCMKPRNHDGDHEWGKRLTLSGSAPVIEGEASATAKGALNGNH